MDVDVFLGDSGWDDPYSLKRQRPDGCRLNELRQGITMLLDALNSSEIEIKSERDFLKIASMYDRPWWRFVDCRFSTFSYEKSQIRLVLWDCEAHSTTLKFRKNKWVAGTGDDLDDEDEDSPGASNPEIHIDLGIGEDLTDEDQEYAILAGVKDLPDDALDILESNENEVDTMEENQEVHISLEAIAFLLQEEGYRAKVEGALINSASQGHTWTVAAPTVDNSDFLLFRCLFLVDDELLPFCNEWNVNKISKLIWSDEHQTVCLEKTERLRNHDDLVNVFEIILDEWESEITELHQTFS